MNSSDCCDTSSTREKASPGPCAQVDLDASTGAPSEASTGVPAMVNEEPEIVEEAGTVPQAVAVESSGGGDDYTTNGSEGTVKSLVRTGVSFMVRAPILGSLTGSLADRCVPIVAGVASRLDAAVDSVRNNVGGTVGSLQAAAGAAGRLCVEWTPVVSPRSPLSSAMAAVAIATIKAPCISPSDILHTLRKDISARAMRTVAMMNTTIDIGLIRADRLPDALGACGDEDEDEISFRRLTERIVAIPMHVTGCIQRCLVVRVSQLRLKAEEVVSALHALCNWFPENHPLRLSITKLAMCREERSSLYWTEGFDTTFHSFLSRIPKFNREKRAEMLDMLKRAGTVSLRARCNRLPKQMHLAEVANRFIEGLRRVIDIIPYDQRGFWRERMVPCLGAACDLLRRAGLYEHCQYLKIVVAVVMRWRQPEDSTESPQGRTICLEADVMDVASDHDDLKPPSRDSDDAAISTAPHSGAATPTGTSPCGVL